MRTAVLVLSHRRGGNPARRLKDVNAKKQARDLLTKLFSQAFHLHSFVQHAKHRSCQPAPRQITNPECVSELSECQVMLDSEVTQVLPKVSQVLLTECEPLYAAPSMLT